MTLEELTKQAEELNFKHEFICSKMYKLRWDTPEYKELQKQAKEVYEEWKKAEGEKNKMILKEDKSLTALFEEMKSAHQYHKEIQEKIEAANELLDEAVALAEKHSIPFSAEISPLTQTYLPEEGDKWMPLVEISTGIEELEQILCDFEMSGCENYGHEYGGTGWQHSAVC